VDKSRDSCKKQIMEEMGKKKIAKKGPRKRGRRSDGGEKEARKIGRFVVIDIGGKGEKNKIRRGKKSPKELEH